MNTDEIVIFQDDELSSRIEVRIEDETVWLNQVQMADLFKATKQNISLHINNIFREGELQRESVVKEYLTTAADGKKYKTKTYNLDVIISVGYRVKSQRGTQFRIWANRILKEYLLKGYVFNHRLEVLEKKVHSIEMKNNEFELILNTGLNPNQGIFFDGQIFDAHSFVSKIIKSAKKTIVLLDNYIDESVLMLLSKRNKGVEVTVYTQSVSGQLKLDLDKFHKQYERIEIKVFSKSHDRFMIIDQTEVFHIGASLKDLGKKWFAFSKLNIDAEDLLGKLD